MEKANRLIEWLRATEEALTDIREELDMLTKRDATEVTWGQRSALSHLRSLIGSSKKAAQMARMEFQFPRKEGQ